MLKIGDEGVIAGVRVRVVNVDIGGAAIVVPLRDKGDSAESPVVGEVAENAE